MVSVDVTFLKNDAFSPDSIHTSQGEVDDLLDYTLASPTPTSVPPLTKPLSLRSMLGAYTPQS